MMRDIEMAVLGIAWHSQENFEKAREAGLKALSFNEIDLKAIFEQMESLEKSQGHWDIETVSAKLGGHVPIVIADILSSSPLTQNIEHYVRELVSQTWRQEAQIQLGKVLSSLRNHKPFDPIDRLKEEAYTALGVLTEQTSTVASWEPPELAQKFVDDFEKLVTARGEGRTPGIPTGIAALDAKIAGWMPSTFNVIGARTSMGKTTLALNFALNAALSGSKVAYFTIEMKAVRLLAKGVSNIGSINNSRIVQADLAENELDRLYFAVKRFANSNLRINDKAGRSIETIESEAWRLRKKGQLDLLFIDYVQQLHCSSKRFGSRQQEITEITGRLQALGHKLEIPIVVLAQLNREAEKLNDGQMPTKSHLKDSGSIEQDADIILLIHRERMDDPTGPTLILVEKNRDGELGQVQVSVDLRLNKFTDFRG